MVVLKNSYARGSDEDNEEEEGRAEKEIEYTTQDSGGEINTLDSGDLDQEWMYQDVDVEEEDFNNEMDEVEEVGEENVFIKTVDNIPDREPVSQNPFILADRIDKSDEEKIEIFVLEERNCLEEEYHQDEIGEHDVLRGTGLSDFQLQEKRKRKQERSDKRERKRIRAEIRGKIIGDNRRDNTTIDETMYEKFIDNDSNPIDLEIFEKQKRKEERSEARERKKIRAEIRLKRAGGKEI